MFTKKSHQDVKKSSAKIQDSRKDSATRFKHLKIVLDHYEAEEAKSYFETNFSHIYFILYDTFVQAENNLKQKVHKAGKEELEGVLALLEKVLCFLPELIGKRWQLHSLTRIFSKLLHRGNSQRLRAESIKYFLLWYQALGENAPTAVHYMFATLVPGFPDPHISESNSRGNVLSPPLKDVPQETAEYNISNILQHPNFSSTDSTPSKRISNVQETQPSTGLMSKLANVSASIFHDTNVLNPVQTVDIYPLLPAGGHEKAFDNESKYFLEILLEGMATSVAKIHWRDRSHNKAMKNLIFLIERFKLYYLHHICPQFDYNSSLYHPNLDLPVQHTAMEDEYIQCRVALIKWITNYAHVSKKPNSDGSLQPSSISSIQSQSSGPTPTNSMINQQTLSSLTSQSEESEQSFTVSTAGDIYRGSSLFDQNVHPSIDSESSSEEINCVVVVRDVLNSSRDHINFTHEVLRQAFLLPFSHSAAIRRVIAVYKDWVQMTVSEIPPFMLENPHNFNPSGISNVNTVHEITIPPRRLRNDSYLGAIQKDNILIRAGLQNVLQVFMTQAANVFLTSPSQSLNGSGMSQQHILEEQTDTCKRVLNIYRYMVMHITMDTHTWEQLLIVLLQITSLVLNKIPPKRKHETLGGSLAPAIFQTLIVTWIKANLNVAVKPELWQSFMAVLARLTHWEDLIKEWAKTMETLTRVLARHVYSLDLSDLPLDRSVEQQGKRGRRNNNVTKISITTNVTSISQSGKSPKTADGEIRREVQQQSTLTRCRSDPHLTARALALAPALIEDVPKDIISSKPRRCHSLDSLRNAVGNEDRDSESGTRSPSPAPSSGVESSSIKDSPLQIDLAAESSNVEWCTGGEIGRGVVCGGTARGWLPDVAAVLWRRMLAALGDPNTLPEPTLHLQVFQYLLHLNETLLKIAANQSASGNMETHVPLGLVAGWCLGAESLPSSYRPGKLVALRLLCSLTCRAPYVPTPPRPHLPLYHRALHHGLTGEDRNVVDVLVKNAAPRYLSLALDGYSLLLLDFVHASTIVLNSTDIGPNCPRTEAVTFLASLLSLPESLLNAPMLQPSAQQYTTVMCPDLKEHVLNILVRACRREPQALARCEAIAALGAHCHQCLSGKINCPRLPDCITNILQALTMKNKAIAKVASDILLLLAEYTDRLLETYPGLTEKIVITICMCLAQLAPSLNKEAIKTLVGSLLLSLAEYCIRMGVGCLMKPCNSSNDPLLLIVFKVLLLVMKGKSNEAIELTSLSDEDFDPNIQLDNMGSKSTISSTTDVKLWAKMICTQLVLFLGHFPLNSSCQLSSMVSENDDSPGLGNELSTPVLTAPHIQLFRLSETVLASFVELPALELPGGGVAPGLVTADKQVRVILRDLTGKSCWDASALYCDPQAKCAPQPIQHLPSNIISTSTTNSSIPLSSLPPPFPPNQLPDYRSAPPDQHQLDHLLQYISHTSPEVLQHNGNCLNQPAPTPLPGNMEDDTISIILSHRNNESEYLTKNSIMMSSENPEEESSLAIESMDNLEYNPIFRQSRLLMSHLGFVGWGGRNAVHLLKRSDRLLRELRNLDAQRSRETHKVAVIYVSRGQEDRNSILTNRSGSPAYESFLAALAWEVELESHNGFLGGLQRGGLGGVSAPYIATLTLEALFHVATRMPSNSPEAILNKTRHLGNDEVHIVWSEHWRPYRRDTLPTQFCDVLIVLYPLPGHLVRCTLSRKTDVPMFGPLFDECILPISIAASLVRATAFNASRAIRAIMPLYQHAYSERARCLEGVISQHKEPTTFEQFIAKVYSPLPLSTHRLLKQESSGSTLAAALIDPAGTTHNKNVTNWINHAAVVASHQEVSQQTVAQHGFSPRPLKRLGPFKRSQYSQQTSQTSSQSANQSNTSTTPPHSPTLPTSRKHR